MKYFILAFIVFSSTQSFAQSEVNQTELKAYVKALDRKVSNLKDQKLCDSFDLNFKTDPSKPAPIGAIAELKPNDNYPSPKVIESCGYLPSLGQSLDKVKYKKLYKVVMCNYSCPDQDHFNLPDLSSQRVRRKSPNTPNSNQ